MFFYQVDYTLGDPVADDTPYFHAQFRRVLNTTLYQDYVILDGVKGVYHGGPSARSEFVWEHNTIYFATDPVSLDHVGWDVIDAKRVSVGMKKLAEDAPDQVSTFVRRQPEHVEIAGALGLGEWDRSKIELRQVKL